MLVMSRMKNEGIVIDDNIVITIVEIRGDKVRLGFELPREVPLHRKEVHDAIKTERDRSLPLKPIRPAGSSPQASAESQQIIERQKRIIQRQSELIHNLETLIRDYRQAAPEDH